MAASRTPISGASSYREIGEYWDQHDLSEHWAETREAVFDVDIQSSVTYFALEKSLGDKLRSAAADNGVSAEELLNGWVREHLTSSSSK
ncbi:MAG TPA: CopG family antitoxin [Thermoanaerobaculia bacterium]|nr:CopG family antitoxin [Thermoanaerobaculia bacterium]